MSNNNLPVALAAETFATISRAIEEGNLNEAIDSLVDASRLDLAACVAGNIHVLEHLAGNIEIAKAKRDAWKRQVEQLEYAEKRWRAKVIDAMQQQRITEGHGDGQRLCLQDNPPALDLKVDVTSKSFSNIISAEKAEALSIPAKYLTDVSFMQLNTAEIKKDIDGGITLPFASIRRGTHLRIRML